MLKGLLFWLFFNNKSKESNTVKKLRSFSEYIGISLHTLAIAGSNQMDIFPAHTPTESAIGLPSWAVATFGEKYM